MDPTGADRQTAVVECPRAMVGRVIGKGGETIKALQQYTGAMIQIDQSLEPTKVTIAGSAQSCALAVSMISDIVSGTFKGFAMLRQLGSMPPEFGEAAGLSPPQPVYIEGYGFVPPTQLYTSPEEMIAVTQASVEGGSVGMQGPLTPVKGTAYPSSRSPHPREATDTSFIEQGLSGLTVGGLMPGAGLPSGLAGGLMGLQPTGIRPGVSIVAPGPAQTAGMPPFWIRMNDPEGRMFYYNTRTGQSQWAPPMAGS